MRIEPSPGPPPEWETLLREDPRATLYLHPRWLRALTSAFPGYRALYLDARDGDRTVGFLPLVRARRFGFHQILSLPFGAHGGPVLGRAAPEETALALAAAFLALASGPRVLRFEMSLYDPSPALRSGLVPLFGAGVQEFRTHVVDLEGKDPEAAYHRNARRSIRDAREAGVEIVEDRTDVALGTLHRLHEAQSRAWAGIPAYSREAIAGMAAAMGEDARLYIARHRGREVAACLCLEHEGREVHPWVSGAAPEARESGAFHLLIDTAIRGASARGFGVWHFGGSGGNTKVEFFKESFGARAVPVLRCFHLAGWARPLRKRPAWDRETKGRAA